MGISKNIRTIKDQAPARKSAPDSTPESRGTVKQRTLKTSIDCSGIGLHSGVKVSMTLNPADASARGISAGDRIRIYNGFGETAYRAKVSEDIRPGVVHIPAGGLPEQGAANHLTGDALSEYENAAQNSYSVEVEKAG